MNLKPELLSLLISYNMTEEEINELASRLLANAQEFENIVKISKDQLDFNSTVREGILNTIADAEVKAKSANNLINKIIESK